PGRYLRDPVGRRAGRHPGVTAAADGPGSCSGPTPVSVDHRHASQWALRATGPAHPTADTSPGSGAGLGRVAPSEPQVRLAVYRASSPYQDAHVGACDAAAAYLAETGCRGWCLPG